MYGIYDNGEVIARFAAPMTVRSNQPVFVSDTLSLKRFISRRSAQRWEIDSNLEPLTTDAQDLMVNLVTRGYSETVTVIVPQNYGVIKSRTANGTATATGTIGSGQVSVTGLSGLVPKGTFVKFAGHSKVYMTTSDVTFTTGISSTINVFPTLRAAVTGTMNYKDDVQMQCLYDTDVATGMVYSDGIMMDTGQVKLLEKL
jgi:hypothetical protein